MNITTKLALVLGTLGLAAFLLLRYVPGFEFWKAETAKTIAAHQQTESVLRDSLHRSQGEISVYKTQVTRWQDEVKRHELQSNAFRQALLVQNSKLDALSTTQEIQARLLAQKLVTALQVAELPATSVSLPVAQAINTRMIEADSCDAFAAGLIGQNVSLQDTVSQSKLFHAQLREIASRKGLFTGKNRQLRQVIRFFPF